MAYVFRLIFFSSSSFFFLLFLLFLCLAAVIYLSRGMQQVGLFRENIIPRSSQVVLEESLLRVFFSNFWANFSKFQSQLTKSHWVSVKRFFPPTKYERHKLIDVNFDDARNGYGRQRRQLVKGDIELTGRKIRAYEFSFLIQLNEWIKNRTKHSPWCKSQFLSILRACLGNPFNCTVCV